MSVYKGTAGPDVINQAKLGLPDWSDIQGLAGNDTITGGNVRIDGGAGDDLITGLTPSTTVGHLEKRRIFEKDGD
jgi:Ca2+-binding RTX toxin-like protein